MKIPIWLLLLLISFPLLAQKQTSQWHFGINIGLDFNFNPPKSTISPLNTSEGCASVSDDYGHLLLFTDGQTIWNKNQRIMVNGQGLMGHTSATQSALIVPQPGNCQRYFVFTVDAAENELVNGLLYSIVDLSKQAGLGEVTEKNILLYTPSTEKLTAVLHANQKDWWVISHRWNSNAFVAYLLTDQGLQETPVVSQVGFEHAGGFLGFKNAVGYMKASPNGKRLAVAISSQVRYEVFDFEAATGLISHPLALQMNINDSFLDAYGIEFSPDSQLLYTTLNNGYYNRVFQFNLQAGSANDILQSAVTVASEESRQYFGIQLGPDQKIYVLSPFQSILDVISKPNALGEACQYEARKISIAGMTLLGFPNFPSGYFAPLGYPSQPFLQFSLGKDTTLCAGQTLVLHPQVAQGNYRWQDGSTDPTWTVSQPGKYWVTVSNACGFNQDSIDVHFTPLPTLDLGPDQIICDRSFTTLTAPGGYDAYRWNTGFTGTQLVVQQSGRYWVEGVINHCTQTSTTLQVTFVPLPTLNLGSDILLCDDKSLVLSAGEGFEGFEWNDGSTSQTITVSESGLYWVKARKLNCVQLDSIQVHVEECALFIPNVITPNGDGANDRFVIEGIENSWKLAIYNRYGRMVYQQQRYEQDWDGESLPSGLYYYLLQHPTRTRFYRGNLTILR